MKRLNLFVFIFLTGFLFNACKKTNSPAFEQHTTDVENHKTDWFHDGLKAKVKSIEEKYYGAFGNLSDAQKGELSNTVLISYDENGFQIVNKNVIVVHYNSNGLKDTITNLDNNGKMSSRFVNTYDVNNHLARTLMYDENGNPLYTWIYEYDTADNIKEEALYNAVGTQINHSRYIYSFDTNGNWTKKVIINTDTEEPVQIIERTLTYY
ncbi:MAG: hypothetical protein LBR28_00745 [Bacteroidales bacterium]|jgi:uncharacterized protein YrzB (UPF0473 family)|nr:hypothetical protein [Bacteroidales bacterium]